MAESTPLPTSVYRYYDKGGLLLYVGITSRATTRQREHNSDKDWWPFVVRQEVEHFNSRPEAVERERKLIRMFHPPFNQQHNPGHRDLRAVYLAANEGGTVADYTGTAAATLGRLRHKIPLRVITRDLETITLAAAPDVAPLASALHWLHPVGLFTHKKVGALIGHALMNESLVLTFSVRQGMPTFAEAAGQVKANSKPFRPWLHKVEIISEAA